MRREASGINRWLPLVFHVAPLYAWPSILLAKTNTFLPARRGRTCFHTSQVRRVVRAVLNKDLSWFPGKTKILPVWWQETLLKVDRCEQSRNTIPVLWQSQIKDHHGLCHGVFIIINCEAPSHGHKQETWDSLNFESIFSCREISRKHCKLIYCNYLVCMLSAVNPSKAGELRDSNTRSDVHRFCKTETMYVHTVNFRTLPPLLLTASLKPRANMDLRTAKHPWCHLLGSNSMIMLHFSREKLLV